MKNLIGISIAIIILLIAGDVSAQTTKTWAGGTSTAWATAANWSPSGVPASTDHVVFNGTGTFQPTLDANRTVANITVTGNTVNLNAQILTVTGTTTLTGGTVNSGTIYFTNTTTTFAGTTFGSKVKVASVNVYFNGSVFNGVVDATRNGGAANSSTGGNTFNDSLKLKTTGGGTITMHSSTSNDAFNGHISVSNAACLTCSTIYGSIYFGTVGSSGIGTLASGKIISIGSSGFAGATLGFIRFTQSGGTAQSITLTTNAVFKLGDKSGGTLAPTTWNGNVTVSSPNILIENSTFNGTATFSKTGTSSNVCNGNNTFNSTCTYNVNNSGYLTLANITGDTYNGASNFNRASSGLIYPAYNGDNYFYGNIAVATNNAAVTLNNSGSGTINFNGSASQTFSKTGTGLITIKSMVMGKTSNSLTLNTPIQVSGTSAFNGGKIITTSTNLITYIDNATVSGASNTSFVSGPAAKVGNDAFSFPTGKSSSYRPIDITSPSSTSTVFTAEYFAANQSYGSTIDTGMAKISNCEYWTLARSGTSNTVNVTLSWNSTNCNNAVPNAYRVAGWNGSQWTNYGNASITGTSTSGTVTSVSNPASYTAFTLANTSPYVEYVPYEIWATTSNSQNFFYKTITKTDISSNTYVAGTTANNSGNYDILLIKYNSSGTILWTQQYDGAAHGNDMVADMTIDASGNVYLTGTVYTSSNSYDIIGQKYNTSGTHQWTYTYNGGGNLYDAGTAIGLGGAYVYITGGAFNSSVNADYATIKLSSSTGANQWTNVWNSSYNSHDLPIKVSISNDTVQVVGAVQISTNIYKPGTIKIANTTGSLISSSNLVSDTTAMTSVTEVAEDASHNIYVTGTISNGVSGSSGVDYHTIKVNYSNLQVAWKKSYSSSGNMEDRANGITVDGSGNVYVTGFTSSATNSHDITTVKYNLDGTQQWVKTYNNEHNGSDEGSAIDADNNGNIYVTGNSHNGSNSDYITMRYSSAGDSDWIIFYNGPNNGNDRAFDITVNNAGVFVSGQTDSLGITKFTTVKYGQLDHPFALEYLNDSVPLNINDELIVKFHDGVIPHDVIDNKSRRAGYIEDFLDDDVIEAMSDKIGTALKHLPVYKIFERMTSDDTLSITRLGDTIRLEDYYNTILIALPNNIDELAAVDSLNGLDSLIEYSALNGVCMLASTPNDAFYVGTDQPSLNSSVFGINIEPAWDIEDGKSNVKVGVNDEAVLWAHEDFGDGTFAGSKIVGGWNFKLNQHISNTTSPGGSHGTSCNGIIGALRNNSIGIAGIAGGNGTTSSGCQLFSMAITIQNFFVPVSVSASAIIEGSAYTPDGSYGYGLHVENNSWGGGLGGSTGLNHNERVLLRRAVRTCWKNGCVFVAARGNDGVDELFFPASYDHNFVLCVSANGLDGDWKDGSDPSDGLSDFTSNFGDDVDVTAPGTREQITTTMFPLNPTNSFCAGAGTNGYSCFSGTSAAAPHVSGVAALLLSKHNTAQGYNNNLAPEDVEYLIRTFATDVGASGYDNFNGMGRLNAGASLAKIDDPEYRIYHSGVYNSRSQSTTQTNQTISLVEPYLNLSAGPYVSDLVEVTDVYNVSFPTGTQVLDGWSLNSRVRGITSSTGFDAENPFASFSSAITNNAGTVTMKTYARHITADFSGHILDVWIPSQASFLKTAFSLHLYKPTVVGVNENSTSHFEVYPNPANSDVNIVMDFPGKQDIIIDILDVQGKLVLKSSYENQSKGIISLPLINLSSGLYMIRVSTDTEQFSSKLLKE